MRGCTARGGERMHFDPENPLIVQSDNTLMLETMGERFAPALIWTLPHPL